MTAANEPPEWMNGLRESSSPVLLDAWAGEDEFDDALASATAVLIDSALDAPLSLARRVRRIVPHLQVVLVASSAQKGDLRRAMLFTPGLGEPWVVEPHEVDRELLERADDIGGRRRDHARKFSRIARKVEDFGSDLDRRGFLPDQYLATLLELLPEPVMALDERDDVLFANPVAESVFGLDGRKTSNADDLVVLLEPGDPDLLEDLLARGRNRVARAQTSLRTAEGERRTFHVSVGPVGGERPVRALVLHDVTEEVEIREILQRQTARLEKQADERERVLEERDRALEDVKTAMRERSRFFANMSHELRTPLNAIIGYNDLLLSGIYGEVPDERRDVLDQIRRASEHLMELIEDILDLSKVEADKLELTPEDVDVEEFLKDLKATVEPLARDREVELRMEGGEEWRRPFRTDPRRLRQILMNLISNAIQYGAGKPVDLRCRLEDDEVVVEVEDRGSGIPSDRIDDIFDEFVQLDGSEGQGTGLGLSIARTLARALGGDLTVDSEPGVGSVFTLRVPELAEEEATGAP